MLYYTAGPTLLCVWLSFNAGLHYTLMLVLMPCYASCYITVGTFTQCGLRSTQQ